MSNQYDVIVVGGGPAGSAAARRCAKNGFKTLLLEKARTPRVKSCTGMIMSRLCQNMIKEEFGDIPARILAKPAALKGYVILVPGEGQEKVEKKVPFTWREHLDAWLNQKAREAGVEIKDGVRVDGVSESDGGLRLTVRSETGDLEYTAKWVIGADGAASTVRKSLFPDLRVYYGEAVQEYHRCPLDVEEGWMPIFFPRQYAPFYFSGYRKGEYTVVETGSRKEQMADFMRLTKETLSKDYGFDINSVPVQKNGCVEPALFRDLLSGQFRPGRGNVLLAGDAAGLLVPVTGEGIGLALKSGTLAAQAVLESSKGIKDAFRCYTESLSDIIGVMKEFYDMARTIREKAEKGEEFLSFTARAWQKTLDVA